jgi:hypothetical protein
MAFSVCIPKSYTGSVETVSPASGAPYLPVVGFVPADITIAELEQQAADIEKQARKEAEPLATELREKAKLLRAWILDLRLGRWTAFKP